MSSLSDVYDGGVGGIQTRRRLQVGTGLLAVGTLFSVAAVMVATTGIGGPPDSFMARELAGILGGLAAPAILGGVVIILPANTTLRVAAAIGAAVSVLGVVAFRHAYPSHWAGFGQNFTPYVTAIYLVGILTLAYCLFAGIATFKRRNDPGGTVTMEIVRQGGEVVKVERPGIGGFGSVGLFGKDPDGTVPTQTGTATTDSGSGSSASGTSGTTTSTAGPHPAEMTGGNASPTSDGGATDAEIVDPQPTGTAETGPGGAAGRSGPRAGQTERTGSQSGQVGGTPQSSQAGGTPQSGQTGTGPADGRAGSGDETPADRYCGTCKHFEYVRDSTGMHPYCGLDSTQMEDMDPCDEWTPR